MPNPGDPQSLNRYAYVRNNPLKYTDPSGHDPIDEAWEQAFYKGHGRMPTDLDRQARLYSIAYLGPVSGGRSWIEADWIYFGQNRDSIYKDISQREGMTEFAGAISGLGGWYNPGEEAQFVSGLALLYTGWPYDPSGANIADMFPDFEPIQFDDGGEYYPNHGMEGFLSLYHLNGLENTHHYVGHLLFGFHLGYENNWWATLIREIAQNGQDKSADMRMGFVAGMHGSDLADGSLTIDRLAERVIHSLGVSIY